MSPVLARLARTLPLTILATALLLVLKLADLGQTVAQLRSGGAVVATAQAEPSPPAAGAALPAAASASAGTPGPAPDPAQAASQVSVPVVMPPAPDPVISPAERQLLQDLRNRRTELDAREQTLQQRESVLDATEHRLTARIAEMAALQARLEQLETARKQHDEANWAGLVKIYETMKPRDAAAIFNDMDMPVLLEVVDRMKDTKAASILAAMQPDRARMLTAQLAAQRTRSTAVPDRAG